MPSAPQVPWDCRHQPSPASASRSSPDAGAPRCRRAPPSRARRWPLSSSSATVTFGKSLSTLVARPALYGWDWNYALESVDGYGPITPQGQARLDSDPNIEATSGVYFGTADIDGVAVPCLFGSTHAVLAPPILSGRTFATPDEIVLGAATLEQLHKHVGDIVDVSHGGDITPVRLRVVGTATMPAVGILDGLHSSMGTGALLSADVLPDDVRNAFGPVGGPNMLFVRLREGVDDDTAARTLDDTAKANDAALTTAPDFPKLERRHMYCRCSGPPRSSTTDRWAARLCCSPPGWPRARWWRSASRWRGPFAGVVETWRC